MASVHHLQQTLCDISHQTLIMLLQYIGKLNKFKYAANIEHTANNMYWFLHANILMDLVLITYLLITSVYGDR